MAASRLREAWARLCAVSGLRFIAKSSSGTSNGSGSGTATVTIATLDAATITFSEQGKWKPDAGKELSFRNVFRWTLAEEAGVIRLERLRPGTKRPVHLFDLAPGDDGVFLPIEPYHCGSDVYMAMMALKPDAIHMIWNVRGAEKDETFHYIYL